MNTLDSMNSDKTIHLNYAGSQIEGKAKQQIYNGKPVKRIHVMVKPFGPVCNLDCDYCYYLHKADLFETESKWKISDDTLESFIKQYFEAQNFEEIIFTWQGGEPTLLGVEFFEKVIALEKKHCPKGIRFENDLQTNGTLIDEKWCKFLKKNNFLVGLSIDGPQDLHDFHRKNRQAKGTFKKVLHTAKLLRRYGINFATLTCVNNATVKEPLRVYHFLRDVVKSPRIQFIPIVEPKVFRDVAPQYWSKEMQVTLNDPRVDPTHPESVVESFCVSPEQWGDFLITVFNEWVAKDFGKVFVHFFEAMVEAWIGRVPSPCILSPMCGKGLAMEHNGDIFSCDHYVYPEYKLGNINTSTLNELAYSSRQEQFGVKKESALPLKCKTCEYEFACYGGCPKDRFLKTENGDPGLYYLCEGWLKFFKHIDPYMIKICKHLGFQAVKKLTLKQ